MKPSDYYLGVSEFFAVIMPGFAVTITGVIMFAPPQTTVDPAALDWAIMAVVSYIVGHILYAVGATWDVVYDWMRPSGDEELYQKIGEIRAQTSEKDCDQINRYKWSRAVLSKEHSEGFMEVLRRESDSKLFRSLIVPLAVLAVFLYANRGNGAGGIALMLMLLSFWRYRGQRSKACIAAYTHVITLFALGKIMQTPAKQPPE
ncbi:MAG: hypothetical protein GY867_07315 [bacterium]|nr:hypothetical protein [bacterium]